MKVTLLAGGVGGAKLAHGLQHVLAPGDLTVIVNVADDAELYGLDVSPDLDTVMYTLAGLANAETGWGVAADTWAAMGMLERYGEPAWFRVGDADLATHVVRTRLRRSGSSLTDVTATLASALGVPSRILPASDDRLRTILTTNEGDLDFQAYFVEHRQGPEVHALRFDGLRGARPTDAALGAIRECELLVIGPSNPIVSIGPILALPGVREAIAGARAAATPHATGTPVIAVSPIVAGRAIKGPADRMLASLGHEASAVGVARLYVGLVDRFVLDTADAALVPRVEELGMVAEVLPTVMTSDADRAQLARAIVALGRGALSSPA